MVGLSSLADIKLMVFRSNVVEHFGTVVDVTVQKFLEVVGRRDQDF